jgi:putative glutamine amidotransferase
MKKPLIGIVLDNEEKGTYSEYPYYILRKHYFNAVIKAGGIPVGIDHSIECVTDYVHALDGLLMPGGDYDIPPAMYGEAKVHESVVTKIERIDFDLAITKSFLDVNKPILGICAGEQLLAVMYGGSLVQDIKSEVAECLDHYQANREAYAHEIEVTKGTLLHKIIAKNKLRVNSHHHQSVKAVKGQLIVSACSSDGVIEAIEVKDKRFCLGVQWHPEFDNDQNDTLIFRAFVDSCKNEI